MFTRERFAMGAITAAVVGWAVFAASPARAAWVLMDDFESAAPGANNLGGQTASNGQQWVTGGPAVHYGVGCETLTGGATNQYLFDNLSGNYSGAGLAFGAANTITQNNTGTLFFRLQIASTWAGSAMSVNGSRVASPTSTTVSTYSNKSASLVLANTGLGGATMSTGVWYNVWYEFDLTAASASGDVFYLYVQRDGDANYATRTLVGGSHTMRNPGTDWTSSNAISSFMLLPGDQVTIRSYFDDIYVDNAAINSANPTIPEPAALAMIGAGGLLIALGRQPTK